MSISWSDEPTLPVARVGDARVGAAENSQWPDHNDEYEQCEFHGRSMGALDHSFKSEYHS
jgi:hypothetical protein